VITGLLTGNFGCSKSGSITPTVPSTSTPATKSATVTTPTTTPTQGSGKTLGDILGQATGINSVKYDMVITAPGAQTMTQQIWVKKNKMRTEMTQGGQSTIIMMDMDAKTMYSYMPAQNMAFKMTFNPTTESAVGEAQSLQSYSPKTVGTETIDGKVCTVVEYTDQGTTSKMWIWQDRGFPIRVETTTAQGKTVIEYKNMDFSDIPDSMFELPVGCQIMQMPGN
jgi:outer membrane lipoprotein-sorting protein